MQYSNRGQTMIREATLFAKAAHGAIGQVRKFNGEPYINHPLRVAQMIMSLRHHTWEMVVTALLHDVVEDTKIDIGTIEAEFGPTIYSMVADVTNVPKVTANNVKRLELDIKRLSEARPQSKTVKVADVYDNLFNVVETEYNFAKYFVPKCKRVMLEALTDCSDALLFGLTMERLASQEKKLVEFEERIKAHRSAA